MNQDIRHIKEDNLDVLDGKEISNIYTFGKALGDESRKKETRNIVIKKVQHHEHNKRRAIKQYPIQYATQFLRGYKIVRNLDHPNINKTYELFKDDKNYYLVMQYVSGGDLFNKIENGKIQEAMAAKFMKQLFSVLQYLHKRNIVHRDIKPENILCENNQDPKEISNFKLIGFTSAVECPNDKLLTNIVGTVKYISNKTFYMAPEVYEKRYNHKCDLWSSGIVLYTMLHGYVPYPGLSIEEVQKSIQNTQLKYKSISNEAKELIMALLTLNPEERISAEEAIQFKFIQINCPESIDLKSLRNLKTFRGYSEIKSAMIQYILDKQMTDVEKDHLTQQFNNIDKNGDGVIDRQELYNIYIKTMKPSDAQEKVDAIFKLADTDNSGKLDHKEFMMAASSQDTILSKVKLSQTFDSINSSRDNYLSRTELVDAIGQDLGKRLWRELREKYDKNKDDKIGKAEFIEYFIK